jgi:hypothetical protein
MVVQRLLVRNEQLVHGSPEHPAFVHRSSLFEPE